MIGEVNIKVSAAHVNMPLQKAFVFQGSAMTVSVTDVPEARGKMEVTGVTVSATNAAATIKAVAAVYAGGAWTATIPASHFAATGKITKGLAISASGKDETGATVSWVLGTGDLEIKDPAGTATPGSTVQYITSKALEGVTVDLTDQNGLVAAVGTIAEKLGGTVLAGFLALLAAAPALGFTPPVYTNKYTDANGNIYQQLGGIKSSNYVAVAVNGGGSGGTDGQAVTNIANGLIATATNGLLPKTGGTIKSVSGTSKLVIDYGADDSCGVLEVKGGIDGGKIIAGYSPGTQVSGIVEVERGGGYGSLIIKHTGEEDETLTERIVRDANVEAAQSALASVSNSVAFWDGYWQGDRIRLSVTNYYGNTSGELPRLRIEEAVTNAAGEVDYWITVWDEVNKYTNLTAQVYAYMAAATNDLALASYRMVQAQLATKAPRAWGSVTSGGEAAPANTVWMTAPNTVFAGGTEYAHVTAGEGTICVLTAKGAGVYTAGEEGVFRFQDDSGENYFGFDVRSAYTLGCRTDGISTTSVAGETLVTLTYDLVSSTTPTILHCTNLTEGVWSEVETTWDTSTAGVMLAEINAGSSPCGFYKAQISYAGGSKFLTNMQADLMGGIAASNETLNVIQSIKPYITSTGVVWRVMQ